uniref:(northern house mosquito) hypothetical protein n=1 Tax=Culex pipiens TaxID=7175 RepID=A0A8D8IZJ5_CULPI
MTNCPLLSIPAAKGWVHPRTGNSLFPHVHIKSDRLNCRAWFAASWSLVFYHHHHHHHVFCAFFAEAHCLYYIPRRRGFGSPFGPLDHDHDREIMMIPIFIILNTHKIYVW